MAQASIPVDLLNPGQVFACLGFLEAADVLCSNAEGGFDWTDEADIRFRLRVDGKANPFVTVLEFLHGARVFSLVPPMSKNRTDKWGVPTRLVRYDDPFPFPDPPSPATLPAVLEGECGARIVIDHWGDMTSRDPVKFWGGSGGYPGVALARDALDLVRAHCKTATSDPFALSANQSSSFRLDWRRDYIPIEVGFSANAHAKGRIVPVGFPLVEILASIGLQNARPKRLSKLEYRYAVIGANTGTWFIPMLMRAALGDTPIPFLRRRFRMKLGWPGKEGQARCITTVTEETTT